MEPILSQKRVLLNSPGDMKNSLYYSSDDTKVQSVEANTVIGRFSQSLTSLAFSSSSQVIIPNQDFVYEVYLTVELPNLTANQTLCAGWLFALIREINYSWGQANISQLRISGKTLLQTIMRECESQEKRSELLRIGGEALVSPNSRPIKATIVLPLPWSVVSASGKMPFDTSILNNPIQLQIQLNPADSIYGGTDLRPALLTSGSVFMRQGVLADRANSIKWDLMRMPSSLYSYPFFHRQSPSTKFNITSNVVNNIELTEFLESDLLNILFSVHYTIDQTRSATGITPNPNNSMIVEDIELLYNGQTVYRADGQAGRLINMLYDSGSSGAADTRVQRSIVLPYQTEQITSYVYQIPFSDLKSMVYDGSFPNTGRFSSQTMVLRFTPRNYDPADATAYTCEAHFTYVYSSVCEIQNGIANIQFS